jgi:hypothetical protein
MARQGALTVGDRWGSNLRPDLDLTRPDQELSAFVAGLEATLKCSA